MGRGGVARDARSDGTTFGAYEPSHSLARQAMRERITTDKPHRQVPNEGRDPKTLPRPSQCEADTVPEFAADSQALKRGRGSK